MGWSLARVSFCVCLVTAEYVCVFVSLFACFMTVCVCVLVCVLVSVRVCVCGGGEETGMFAHAFLCGHAPPYVSLYACMSLNWCAFLAVCISPCERD